MNHQSRALRAEPDSSRLVRGRGQDAAEIKEQNNPVRGMMWAFLISVILWLALGVLWAALP